MKIKLCTIIILITTFNCIGNTAIAQDNGYTNKDEAKNEYIDSLKEGKWIEYTDALYRPSEKEDSLWTYFYRLSIYKAGKENGIVRYYSTHTGKLYDELLYIDGKRNGIDRKYDEKGQLREESFYINDKMNGLDRLYFDKKISLEMPITDDKIDGVMKEYYPNGQLSKETPYTSDKKNGIMKAYDENGKLLSYIPYANDAINGIEKDYCYYENGKLWWKASIDYNNQESGTESEYDESGNLLLEENVIYGNEEHFEWEEKDKEIISSIIKLNRNDPKEIEALFSGGKPIFKDTLGFGWTGATMYLRAGGYSSISSTFYYYKDSIISYMLQPQSYFDTKEAKDYIDSSLQKKYLQWYSPYFAKLDTVCYTVGNIKMRTTMLHPFKYNEQGIFIPLKEYQTVEKKHRILLSKKLLYYMSPLTGLYYGYGGGLPPTTLPNRKEFNEIKDSLTNEEIIALLYSINPVSRLTAIEYCIKKNNPIINERKIKKWIDKIYTEVPRISTMYGCIGTMDNSKDLVEKYAKMNY